MNTHIDQLAEWYADAERITDTNLPRAGDTLIFPYNAGGYAIEVEEDGWTPDTVIPGEPARILSRAPIPKPAWHDAVAVVIARIERREVCVSMPGLGTWVNPLNDHELSTTIIEKYDPTPLIEAKVTDEMIERGYYAENTAPDGLSGPQCVRRILTAALGLETT